METHCHDWVDDERVIPRYCPKRTQIFDDEDEDEFDLGDELKSLWREREYERDRYIYCMPTSVELYDEESVAEEEERDLGLFWDSDYCKYVRTPSTSTTCVDEDHGNVAPLPIEGELQEDPVADVEDADVHKVKEKFLYT